MAFPLNISFRNCAQSEAIVRAIEDRAAKLERIFPRIISCSVMVEAPHASHAKGNLYRVRVDLSVPGSELVVGQDRSRHGDHEDVYLSIRDAFNAAHRQLVEYKQKMRRDTKIHLEPAVAKVARMFPTEDYGFLETGDGRQVYFHRNAVLNGGFDRIEVGTEVRFVEHPGEGFEGPQASTVAIEMAGGPPQQLAAS